MQLYYTVLARTERRCIINKPDKPEIKTVQVSEARQRLPDLLNRVYQGKTRIVVERSGIPIAAIVSVDELQQLESFDQQREELWALVQHMSEAFKDVPPDELEREVNRAVAQARKELAAERAQEQPSSPTP
jgi:prevent-host-death family protein